MKMTNLDKYKAADKELAFLIYPGLESIFPDKLEEVMETNCLCWTRENYLAFKLIVEYACYPSSHELSDSVLVDEELEYIENHQDKETAVRFAIVNAVITKLKKRKPM
jgi:hypothetical protein